MFCYLDDSLSDSPILSRCNTSASSTPSRRLSKSKNKISSVKEGVRTSGLTTDSDSSPYTSGVPIADNINREVEMGWDETDISMMMNQNGRTNDSILGRNGRQAGSMNSISLENSLYPSSFHSRTNNQSPDSYSARDSDDEINVHIGGSHPNITTLKSHSRSVDDLLMDTDSLFDSVHDSLRMTQQNIVQSQTSQDFGTVNYLSSPIAKRQSKISEDMAEADRLCDEMLNGLQTTSKPQDEDEDCYTPEIDDINFRRYIGRMRHNTESPSAQLLTNRLSIASNNLSFSEPDLVVLSLKNDKSPSHSTFGREKMDDEDNELLTSLPATIFRKFVESSNCQSSKNDKQRGGKFRFKAKKNKQNDDKERKSEPATMPDRRHTLNPSASLYFTASNEIEKPRQSPSRGIANIFKRKDKDGKKIKKTPSIHGDHVDGGVPDTGRRPRTGRASSLAPSFDRHVYMNIDEFGGNFVIIINC